MVGCTSQAIATGCAVALRKTRSSGLRGALAGSCPGGNTVNALRNDVCRSWIEVKVPLRILPAPIGATPGRISRFHTV